MCCCGCELALTLAALQAADGAPKEPGAAIARGASAVRADHARPEGETFASAIVQAVRLWFAADMPLARLDRGS